MVRNKKNTRRVGLKMMVMLKPRGKITKLLQVDMVNLKRENQKVQRI